MTRTLKPDDHKRSHERRVFERFCRAAGFSIVPGTLRQPAPPAPDITVTLVGLGKVSFELVSLDDNEERKASSTLHTATAFIDTEFARAPAEKRRSLQDRYSDAEITIEFLTSSSRTDRIKALAGLWDILELQNRSVHGRLDISALDQPPAIRSVWICRVEPRLTPKFRTFSLTITRPVDPDRIIDKLSRHYACDSPLDLLAYKQVGELAFIDDVNRLTAAVVTYLPTSAFRNVWAYECMTHRVHGFPNPPKTRIKHADLQD